MKTIITLTVLAALILSPRSARALGDTEAAILGGLVGGVIIGAAIDNALDNNHHYQVSTSYRGGRGDRHHGRDRHYDRGSHGPNCSCNSCRPASRRDYGHHDRHSSGGYWTYRTVKVWVPKSVSYSYDDCGRRTKHYRRGYWSYRKEKVWVSSRSRW